MKPMISDESLRTAVVRELESDPEVAADHISVLAVAGAITLGGHVMSYHEKHVAVRAAERVEAVRAVADDIEVRDPSLHERGDDEIAEEITKIRDRDLEDPDSVWAQVREGRVILHGKLESAAQRDAIERAAHHLRGVRAVDNVIEVTSPTEPAADSVEHRVAEALAGVRDLTADSVQVTMSNGTATLKGHLPSLEALQRAFDAAMTAPGVTGVESEIVVAIQAEASRGY